MTQYGLFLWVLYASFVPGLRMYLFNAILAFSRCRYGLVWSPAVLLVTDHGAIECFFFAHLGLAGCSSVIITY